MLKMSQYKGPRHSFIRKMGRKRKYRMELESIEDDKDIHSDEFDASDEDDAGSATLEGASSIDVEIGEAVETLFSNAQIFACLDVHESKLLFQKFQTLNLVAGETLCRVGDTDRQGLFVVKQGGLGVFLEPIHAKGDKIEGREIKVATLNVGESVGELDLLDGSKRSVTCRAEHTGCVLMYISREDFLDFVSIHPLVLQKYIQMALGRLWRVCHYTLRDFLRLPSNSYALVHKNSAAQENGAGFYQDAIPLTKTQEDTLLQALQRESGTECESRESNGNVSWFASDWMLSKEAPEISGLELAHEDSEATDDSPYQSYMTPRGHYHPDELFGNTSVNTKQHSMMDRVKKAVKGAFHTAKASFNEYRQNYMISSDDDIYLSAAHNVRRKFSDLEVLENESEPRELPAVLGRTTHSSPASLSTGWDVVLESEFPDVPCVPSTEDFLSYGRQLNLGPMELLHDADHVSHSMYVVIHGSLVIENTLKDRGEVVNALIVPFSVVDAASFLTSTRSGVRIWATEEGCTLVAFGAEQLRNLKSNALSLDTIVERGFSRALDSHSQGEEDEMLSGCSGSFSDFTSTPTNETKRIPSKESQFFASLLTISSRALAPVIHQFISLGLQRAWFKAGECLYRQNELADSIFIIINGRVRLLRSMNSETIDSEEDLGRGESTGAVWAVTGGSHDTTALAVRDVETVKMSKSSFEILSGKIPNAATRLLEGMAKRLAAAANSRGRTLSQNFVQISGRGLNARASIGNSNDIATIAVIPAGKRVLKGRSDTELVKQLAEKLQVALSTNHGPCTIVDYERIKTLFPSECGRLHESFHRAKVTARLDQIQEDTQFVLLVSDCTDSPWSYICAEHADCCVLVAEASQSTSDLNEMERKLVWKPLRKISKVVNETIAVESKSHAMEMLEGIIPPSAMYKASKQLPLRRIDLILVHDETEIPRNTASWLKKRPMLTRHHHIRLSSSSDLDRIGRWLAGKAVGLVLSGGGSRGLAHVGVLKALHKAGIPIDVIGGSSQGAFIAGLYAQQLPWAEMMQRVREYSRQMGSVRALLADLTLPILSVFSGAGFDRVIRNAFSSGPQRIEDLWLQFYAVTTNLTAGCAMVHLDGILWKVVRASMSLVGLVPPVITEDKQILADGGYGDNIPLDALKSLGVGAAIVVDVEDKDQSHWECLSPIGEGGLSGWKIMWVSLWDTICPFRSWHYNLRAPTHAQLMNSLTWMAHQTNLMRIANSHDIDLYLRPPVAHFKLADYRFMDLIVDDSTMYSMHEILRWKRTAQRKGIIPTQDSTTSRLKPSGSIMCMTALRAKQAQGKES